MISHRRTYASGAGRKNPRQEWWAMTHDGAPKMRAREGPDSRPRPPALLRNACARRHQTPL